MYGHGGTGDGHGDKPEQQAKYHAEEDAAQVGLVEGLHGIADKLLNIVEGTGRAHHHYAVAILQPQVVGGQQFEVASQHPAHVNTISRAQLQVYQMLAIEHLARNDHRTAGHLGIYVVPVYLVGVPVGRGLAAEEYFHRLAVVLVGNDQHLVVLP